MVSQPRANIEIRNYTETATTTLVLPYTITSCFYMRFKEGYYL